MVRRARDRPGDVLLLLVAAGALTHVVLRLVGWEEHDWLVLLVAAVRRTRG